VTVAVGACALGGVYSAEPSTHGMMDAVLPVDLGSSIGIIHPGIRRARSAIALLPEPRPAYRASQHRGSRGCPGTAPVTAWAP
jgi:hypothetical protein